MQHPDDTHWVCPEDRAVFGTPTPDQYCPSHGLRLHKVEDGYEINPWSGERDKGIADGK